MRFWDSTALVPLCLSQPLTDKARRLYEEDPELVVWWGSSIECASAFARSLRDRLLDPEAEAAARSFLGALSGAWYEILPGDGLREQAHRLLRLHPLRAGDSLQLAAALEWGGTPPTGDFVTFDDRLKAAARLEGFTVV
ncbi:MAG TPA: type II toxin-antitoxin system VapC family toxin [Gemmatimonadales bacterium]